MFNYNSIDFNKNNIIKFNKDIFKNKSRKILELKDIAKYLQTTFEKNCNADNK